jgi:hypothetical protein
MRRAFLFAAAILASLFLSRTDAQAFRFGQDERIILIEDVKLKGPNGEALFLAHMTRTQNFIGGYSLDDAGYVLGSKAESKKYFNMPTGEQLARFQKEGLLPDPLPPYKLNFFDYLFGYSVWWIVGLAAIWYVVGALRKKKRAAEAPPTRPAA